MTLDLNYLKKVNDNLGHDEGDKFIQAAANILKAAVGEHGETFRTGSQQPYTVQMPNQVRHDVTA